MSSGTTPSEEGFEAVTVLDRDPLPDEAVARDGAPQSHHPHVMLEAGRATLEDLFPGFVEDVLSAGGLLLDGSTDLTHYFEGDTLADGPERLPLLCASRPLLEQVLRRRVRALDGVTVRDDCRMTDYRYDEATGTVTGVEIDDGTGETELAADLVVDATGRTSRTPNWLEDNGFQSPPVDEVKIDIAYSTAVVERPPEDRRGFLVPPSAPRKRGAVVIPVEGDRWEVLLQGVHDADPPTEREAFVEYARSLPVAEVGQIAASRPWVSEEIGYYPFPASVRRRYEALDRFPDGLVVLGDALASFNPVYGQGMSVAAMDALLLHHTLATDGLDDVGRRFFDRAGDVVDDVWQIAVGADFGFPETEGPKPAGTGVLNWYLSRLLHRAHSDGDLTNVFTRVLRLEQPPSALLRPGVVRRVLLPI
ncbi:oxidoreductase [Halobacteriales archaeon QS_1_68_20]|nr:MAG: oxidoreductase [Halobacteriales archaeon QS_1_68_20]